MSLTTYRIISMFVMSNVPFKPLTFFHIIQIYYCPTTFISIFISQNNFSIRVVQDIIVRIVNTSLNIFALINPQIVLSTKASIFRTVDYPCFFICYSTYTTFHSYSFRHFYITGGQGSSTPTHTLLVLRIIRVFRLSHRHRKWRPLI